MPTSIKRFKNKEGPTDDNPDKFNYIILTNFSYFYDGQFKTNPKGEYNYIASLKPEVKLMDTKIIEALDESLARYSSVPMEV